VSVRGLDSIDSDLARVQSSPWEVRAPCGRLEDKEKLSWEERSSSRNPLEENFEISWIEACLGLEPWSAVRTPFIGSVLIPEDILDLLSKKCWQGGCDEHYQIDKSVNRFLYSIITI
jgi:hypothetical protein